MDTGLGSHSFARVPRAHRYLINPDEQTSVPISIILDSLPSHFFFKELLGILSSIALHSVNCNQTLSSSPTWISVESLN